MRWLSSEQYPVLEARNAEEAIELLAKSPDVKVIIADLQMPGQGGAWLVEQMRLRFPSTAIVLATANDQVPGSVSLQPNVAGYLVKPLTRDAVLQYVRRGVRKSDELAEKARVREATDPIESFLDRKLTGGDV